MDEASACALCRSTPEGWELVARPLVPPRFLEAGVFELDPLGTGGATVALCPACAEAVGQPMLLAEDVSEFSRAVDLHRQAHSPAAGTEQQAARVRLWHRALHLGIRALATELAALPSPAAPKPEPDQMGLFVSRSARLARVETSLAEARLDTAAELAAEVVRRYDLPEARYLSAQLGPLRTRVSGLAGAPEELSMLARHPEKLLDRTRLTIGLFAALGRGLHRLAAEAAERQWQTVIAGRPAGWHWLRAGEPERARAALEAAVDKGQLPGTCLALLGDIAFHDGRAEEARELYRRAFCAEPDGVPAERIEDEVVRGLLDEARGLELEPPAECVPMVGYAMGVFRLPEQPDGQGECREFHTELLEGRRTNDPWHRRRMQQLALGLFEQIFEAGRL
ncbi:MAG: tetratricopeptide repeat protein [Deltaproteobacteria bacterium]|nr:tetratricopeptide repeat protein [Deltaproteobacteria bacterium]